MTQKQPLRNNFRKAERLCSHKALAELFAQGEAFLVYPIRCVYRRVEFDGEPMRVLISAPKKNHRRAVHRNLLKRRIREAYRLNRQILKDALTALYVDQKSALDTEVIAHHQTGSIQGKNQTIAKDTISKQAPVGTTEFACDQPSQETICTEHPALNKEISRNPFTLEFSLSYIAKDILDYHTIENAVKKILKELRNRNTIGID